MNVRCVLFIGHSNIYARMNEANKRYLKSNLSLFSRTLTVQELIAETFDMMTRITSLRSYSASSMENDSKAAKKKEKRRL